MTGARAASAPPIGLALVVSASQAWTRRPGETSAAYAAFCTYRDLGPGRSLDAAYARAQGLQKGDKRASGHFQRWHRDYAWRSRAEAFDAFLDQAKRQAEVEKWKQRGEELVEKQFAVAMAMLKKAEQMLAFPLARQTAEQAGEEGATIEVTIEPAKWNFNSIARLAKVAVELGRLACGLRTKHEQSVHFEIDPSQLTDEQLERIIGGEHPAAVLATPGSVQSPVDQ